jgi:hypothetical protein
MPNFLVTLKFDPGTPKHYAVQDVPDHKAARDYVRNLLGYDPGVAVTLIPVHKNEAAKFSTLGH